MKNFFRLLLCVACACVMMGCEKEVEDYNLQSDKYVKFVQSQDTITIGSTRSLSIAYIDWETETKVNYEKIEPKDYASKKIKWSTENENIATVDQYGNVTAQSEGTTKIHIEINGKIKQECTLTISKNVQFQAAELKKRIIEKGYDIDGDREISIEEAKNVTSIMDDEYDIIEVNDYYSLTGVEYLVNLESLSIRRIANLNKKFMDYNFPHMIDLSKNSKLKNLYCSGPITKKIILPENLEYLYFSPGFPIDVESIEIPESTKLNKIQLAGNVDWLTIDLTKVPNLEEFTCLYNNITVRIKKEVYEKLEIKSNNAVFDIVE